MKQIAKLSHHGEWTVLHDINAKANPYKIVLAYWDPLKGTVRKKTVERYGDLHSCMLYLASLTDKNL